MEFEMAAVFDMVSVFEIFTEVTIPRKVSKMDIETATLKEVTLIRRGLMYERYSFNCCEGRGCGYAVVEGVCDSLLYSFYFKGGERSLGTLW